MNRLQRKKSRYANPLALKQDRWSNFWENAHPRAFHRHLWLGRRKRRKVVPVWGRDFYARDRDAGVTHILSTSGSTSDPYRNVMISRHVIAERIQNQRVARLGGWPSEQW